MFEIILFLILWIVCGVIACGLCFASDQRRYETMIRVAFFREDQFVAAQALVLGPVCLLFGISDVAYKGWLWPWGAKAREEVGII